ncbi:MAG TPA: rRNA maturation RNase YbeY [Magnetospirillaceae bacterium]|nr:rRNA maturation RNase YbeY [Magnetospirillaceae bacterium]
MTEIAIDIAYDAWNQKVPGVEERCRHVAAIALGAAAANVDLPAERLEVSILLTDDDQVRDLNAEYRQQDKPTNVLSFAALDEDSPIPPDGPILLGDVIVAFQTTEREARDEGKSFADHLSHLVVHGVLHLLGYDHIADDEAEEMESLERSILAALGVSDPYKDAPS